MREQGERRTKSYEEVLVIKLQEATGVGTVPLLIKRLLITKAIDPKDIT